MADHSDGALDEAHSCKSEASKDLKVCFDKSSPEKWCFVVDLAFFSPTLHVFSS